MPTTPEDAQKLTNLHQRILANVAAGKKPQDGISQDEVREALDIVRADRGKALAAGVEKAPKKGKKAKAPSAGGQSLDAVLAAKFPGMNFD